MEASTGRELNGRALAASLAVTLLELGVTLTASFFFSRWITKMVQSNNNAGTAGGGAVPTAWTALRPTTAWAVEGGPGRRREPP